MQFKDLSKEDRVAIGTFFHRLCMAKAVAELCLYLGVDDLTPQQERECLHIMRDNFERFDPERLWQDYQVARELQGETFH